MDNRTYAICGTLLWIALAAVLCFYGDDYVRKAVAGSLFLGAMSQFIGQDSNPKIVRIALGMAHTAIGLTAAALIFFIF